MDELLKLAASVKNSGERVIDRESGGGNQSKDGVVKLQPPQYKRTTIINVPGTKKPSPPQHTTNRKRPTTINEPTAKRNKAERVCSVCKTSKSLHDAFSKNQRSKGDDAKCKDCISAQQQKQQTPKEANRKRKEDQKAIQEANRKRKEEKRLRLEKERQDRIAKQKQEEEERKLATQLLEAEEKNKTIAENVEKEANIYKAMKATYESYAQKLKDSGKDIEQEMITPSNLLYVVTSISKRRDNNGGRFSPRLHGIYTTARKAQVCARHVFGSVSKSYRDGKFLKNEDRTAKSDISEFFIPAEGNSRVLFELFGKTVKPKWGYYGKDEYIYDCSAIAITAVPIDKDDVAVDLPFLRSSTHAYDSSFDSKNAVVEGKEVYPVFQHMTSDCDSTDVNLCGIFRDKDQAKQVCVEERKEILRVQKNQSPYISNGIPFYQMLHENCCSVKIESISLDQDDQIGKKLDFGTKKESGIWMKPDIEWY